MENDTYLVDNISAGKYGEGKNFLEIIFRVAKICNQNCKFCFVIMTNQAYKYEYIVSEFEKIIDKYKDIDNIIIQLSGGEPMIHPKIWELIDYFHSKAINTTISMQTNAVFFSLDKNVERLKLIPKDKLSFFVSFHSHKPEIYDSITGTQNQYSKAVQGIKNLCANANQITINTVITSYNLEYFDEYLRFFYKEFLSVNKNARLNVSIASCIDAPKSYLHIKYSDLVDKINDNLDYIKLNKINFSNINSTGSDCDLPYCLSNKIIGNEEHLQNLNVYFTDKKLSHDRQKFPKCKNCKFESICSGILNTYVDLHGDKEFEPIVFD